MNYVIFEHNTENYYPLSEFRALWHLKCGAFSYLERLLIFIKNEVNEISYLCREELAEIEKERLQTDKVNNQIEGSFILINCLVSKKDDKIINPGSDTAVFHNNELISANFTSIKYDNKLSPIENAKKLKQIKYTENIFLPAFLWEIVLENGEQIKRDFKYLTKKNENNNVTIKGDSSLLLIENDVEIDPFVLIDTTKGPVVIKKGAKLNSFTNVEGPCYIGENCLILGAKIREGCHIGKNCRIGGEVEDSIFQSYSNKYHDGFIGHAYVGQWVNLGALTTNSDLKNDYSEVKCILKDKIIDTGETKVGALIGDFSKASIGTLFNTGAVIGNGSMIVFTGRMTPQYLPEFSWFLKNEIRDKCNINNFIETLRKMMERRSVDLSDNMKKLIIMKFDNSKNLRKEAVENWTKTI